MAAILRFVITMFGVAFASATFLAIYESIKPGGFDERWERTIIIFSLVVGLLVALMTFGLLGPPGGAYFDDNWHETPTNDFVPAICRVQALS